MTGLKSKPSTKAPKVAMVNIVADLHDRTGVEKHHITAVLNGLKSYVVDKLAEGMDVDLGPEFGKFTLIEVAGRTHYVPSTGGHTETPERFKMRFRPGPKLRNFPPPAGREGLDQEQEEEPEPERKPRITRARAKERPDETMSEAVAKPVTVPVPSPDEPEAKPRKKRARFSTVWSPDDIK